MIASLSHNLVRLVSFRGRETRAQFWPFAGVVFIGCMAAYFVVMIGQVAPFMTKIEAFARTNPDKATVTSAPGHYTVDIHDGGPEITAAFTEMAQTILTAAGAMVIVMVAFYAAAVTRRLHDRGASGLWGLLPLPFLAFSLTAMPRLMASFDSLGGPDFSLFFLMCFSNVAYMGALLLLIVLLSKQSDPGINRYGPPIGL